MFYPITNWVLLHIPSYHSISPALANEVTQRCLSTGAQGLGWLDIWSYWWTAVIGQICYEWFDMKEIRFLVLVCETFMLKKWYESELYLGHLFLRYVKVMAMIHLATCLFGCLVKVLLTVHKHVNVIDISSKTWTVSDGFSYFLSFLSQKHSGMVIPSDQTLSRMVDLPLPRWLLLCCMTLFCKEQVESSIQKDPAVIKHSSRTGLFFECARDHSLSVRVLPIIVGDLSWLIPLFWLDFYLDYLPMFIVWVGSQSVSPTPRRCTGSQEIKTHEG